MVKLLQLPRDSRPREKLLQRGAEALSDAELLAIFLRVGVPGMNAVALSEYLLTHFGSLQGLLTTSESEFCQIKGMGQAKFVQLQAALEMTKRYLYESLAKSDAFCCAEQSKSYVASVLRGRHREAFWVLFLNQQHQLIASEMLFEGTLNAASVYPREVVKRALDHHAAAVMLAHNHPSGHTDPSEADHQLTRLLVEALSWVEIRVLDHFIVGEGAVLSFAEHGWMPAIPERIKKV